jgi:hypothetical protein
MIFNFLLINNSNLTFDFDTAANIVGHIFYVTINELNWHYSSCTCSFFQKKNFVVTLLVLQYPEI